MGKTFRNPAGEFHRHVDFLNCPHVWTSVLDMFRLWRSAIAETVTALG